MDNIKVSYKPETNRVNKPSVTVLMPVYNAEKYLKEAIDSVLSQTFEDFEFLILDDGSTDSSRDIVREYRDDRIRYEIFPHDYLTTLNNGIDLSRGKYIARMDADDIMMPNRLQVQFDFMEKHAIIAASGSFFTCIGNEQNIIKQPVLPDEVLTSLMLFCAIANPTSMIRRRVVVDHHIRYDHNYIFAEDYKFWTELAKYGPLTNIPLVLLKYRISKTQVSCVHKNQQVSISQKISREMISYFLSHIEKKENRLMERVSKELVPYLEEQLNDSAISFGMYSQFMFSLVCGLRKQKYISI